MEKYIAVVDDGQVFLPPKGHLVFDAHLTGFTNTETRETFTRSKAKKPKVHEVIEFKGELDLTQNDRKCDKCNHLMHIHTNKSHFISLRHTPIGGSYTNIVFPHIELFCPCCQTTKTAEISFKAEGHRITKQAETYCRDLLAYGFTLKEVAHLTGIDKNAVKDIDKKRLQELYTIDGKQLKVPVEHARFLGIDEFKLHDNRQFATHIMNLESGHILYLARGKKKEVVYNFIDLVGMEWMSHVESLACDMNSDFAEAFKEKCPHVTVVFDHFHIIKNFNDKVVNEIRKDVIRELEERGDLEAAISLKGSKYILPAKRQTLQDKDRLGREGVPMRKESSLFNVPTYTLKDDHESRYDALLTQNRLFIIIDIVKEKLDLLYKAKDSEEMDLRLADIIGHCMSTGNKHFKWFAKLLFNHMEGIISHSIYRISTGPIEGTNNRIKTLRRESYGLPDDEYFFLKMMDASYQRDYRR